MRWKTPTCPPPTVGTSKGWCTTASRCALFGAKPPSRGDEGESEEEVPVRAVLADDLVVVGGLDGDDPRHADRQQRRVATADAAERVAETAATAAVDQDGIELEEGHGPGIPLEEPELRISSGVPQAGP